jgi:hypothetical protein
MNMAMDYEVFQPDSEGLAKIIVKILQEKGYDASYQLGYPNNKIFIRADSKEEADRISEIIRASAEKFRLTGSEIITEELSSSIGVRPGALRNVANLTVQPELESEPEESEQEPTPELEPEPEEFEPESTSPELELEPEEYEPESTPPELEPEPEEAEPESMLPELELEIEEFEPEPTSPEPEPEPEGAETEPKPDARTRRFGRFS